VKILSPLDNLSEVAPLVQAGADEFYCGLLTEDWHNRYIAGAINRRPGGGANFTRLDDLAACVTAAKAAGASVILTLNEHYYTDEQYPYLMNLVRQVKEIGVDALMVADIALMLTLGGLKDKPKVYVSTGGAPFNAETVRLYRDIGAARITFPRHLTLHEMRLIRDQVPEIEVETFILNSRCPYVDGYCTFQHGLGGKEFPTLHQNACMLEYDIGVECEPGVPEIELGWQRQHLWETVHVDDFPCGACAIYDLSEMNVTSGKIVGRGNPSVRKLADVRFVRTLLDYLENEKPGRAEFYTAARQLYTETYRRTCRTHLCYFPEVMA
jgi:putative protease